MSTGNLIVISGSSGVGKTSVLQQVLHRRPDLQFSVSATSRPPRPGETDGVQYFFVSRPQFEQMIDEDRFVEYDFHMGNYYGTLKSQLAEKTTNGNMVLDVEPVGAMNIRKLHPNATLIFLAAPSMEALEQRLRLRHDTDEEQLAMRLERAKWEYTQKDRYDYVVVNDVLDRCVDEVLHIIAQKLD